MTEDRDPIDLGARRKAKKQERQRASLARWKPSFGQLAWAILLAAAAVGYFVFGSDNPFRKADLHRIVLGNILVAGDISA